MVITIVIVVRTSQNAKYLRFQLFLPHCPSTTISLVQDSMPLRFLCELKKIAEVRLHISSYVAILLRNFCIILLLHSWRKCLWCKICYKIERRFYQEALSSDLEVA